MANVICNLPKTGEEVRYVDVIIGTGGKSRLCVDAELTGTITIGAVVIKDNNTGLESDVILGSDGYNGLVVVTEDVPKSKVMIYGTSLVAIGGTLTIATYTVPVGKKFTFTGAIIGGAQEGEFDMLISSATICKIRNSGSNRTIIAKFPEDPEASAGAIIDVKVTNIGEKAKSYEATIFGYTR